MITFDYQTWSVSLELEHAGHSFDYIFPWKSTRKTKL